MPTPLDRALNSRNVFLTFAGIVTAVAAWTILGPSEMFPREADPTGEPESWTKEEMRKWLAARNLHPNPNDSREELLERIKANPRTPRT